MIKTALVFLLGLLSQQSFALYGSRPVSGLQGLDALATLHLSDPENPEYDFFCSGVLVSSDTVLTTGHCIEVMASEVYEQWNMFAYEPQRMKVKLKGIKYAVAGVTLAPSYFEATGFAGEDLALIKLKVPVSIKPLKIAPLSILTKNLPALMIARGQFAETALIGVRDFSGHRVLFTDGSKGGVCEGDSGGALLVKTNGEFQLAGLLSAQGEGCVRQTGFSIYPRISF